MGLFNFFKKKKKEETKIDETPVVSDEETTIDTQEESNNEYEQLEPVIEENTEEEVVEEIHQATNENYEFKNVYKIDIPSWVKRGMHLFVNKNCSMFFVVEDETLYIKSDLPLRHTKPESEEGCETITVSNLYDTVKIMMKKEDGIVVEE